MYSKLKFAKRLKQKAIKEQKQENIGKWAYYIYLRCNDKSDITFIDVLLDIISLMQGRTISYDKLNKMADKILKEETNIQKNDL